MTPQYNSHPFSDSNLRPNKVISYLSDDSMSGEFPKRAYSVGSRPPRKLIQHLHHLPVNKPNMSNNGRSSSAPHLIEKKLRGMVPYTAMDSSLSCSPSQSIKSSVSDSDSFIEMDYIRPRTSSDSFGCRPRSSSFGKVFQQGHRPRSSSYGTSARGKLGSYESVRLTSKELHLKLSNESLTGQLSGASSSDSLKKTEQQPKIKQKSEYVDMRLDKSEAPGYIDMTVNPKSVGNKSSSSLSSSPAITGVTSPIRPTDSTSSPSIKVIKPSGKTQNPVGFPTPSSNSLSSIPPQSSLFSPINFSPSGSRSPSVKGRSPASSGRESEEETYLPYQPAASSSESHKGEDKKGDHKKEKKSKHKDKDKKHSETKEKKQAHKGSDTTSKSSENVLGVNIQEMKMDRDSMYMDFEPGALEISQPSDSNSNSNPIVFSLGPDYSNSASSSDIASKDLSQNQQTIIRDSSPYMEYEPEVPVSKLDSDENIVDVSDDSAYMQYEPGSVANNQAVDEQSCPVAEPPVKSSHDNTPPIPPRKLEGINSFGELTQNIDNQPGGTGIEKPKGGGLATHVDLDPYMDFDPDNVKEQPSEMKTPTRVRSFITDTSMEDELGKDDSNVTTNKSGPIAGSMSDSVDRSKVVNDNISSEKCVHIKSVIKPSTYSIPENDEYVGLDYSCKSSERLLLGGITPAVQTLTHDKLLESSKNNKVEDVLRNERFKNDVGDDRKNDIRIKTSVSKGSISSLEELKIEESLTDGDAEETSRKLSVSSKISTSPQELTKQSSLPCMNLPAEILEMQISREKAEKGGNSENSRHSCSDLTVSYEPMNFPSDTMKSSELSSSQQQLSMPGLNYASLDLGSRENVSDNKLQQVKSRHSSSADEAGPLPPTSYAQIDFKMSENLKNMNKQDVKSAVND